MEFDFSLPLSAEGAVYTLLVAVVVNLMLFGESLMSRAFRTPSAMVERIVDILDDRYNQTHLPTHMQRVDGWSTVGSVVLLIGALAFLAEVVFQAIPYGWVVSGFAVAALITQRSLLDKLVVLKRAIEQSTGELRATVALYTGRDTRELETDGLARASIEFATITLAEGFIAPVFYYLLFGLPGIAIYKAINFGVLLTHEREEQFEDFGQAFRRINQILSYIPARIAAVLVAISGFYRGPMGTVRAIHIMLTDAGYCFRPSVGPPVAAMAGAVDVQLGGEVDMIHKTLRGEIIHDEGKVASASDLSPTRNIVALCYLLVWLAVGGTIALGLSIPADFVQDWAAGFLNIFTTSGG